MIERKRPVHDMWRDIIMNGVPQSGSFQFVLMNGQIAEMREHLRTCRECCDMIRAAAEDGNKEHLWVQDGVATPLLRAIIEAHAGPASTAQVT